MRLEVQHKPRSRGVSQLMYVGDDDAVENELAPRVPWKLLGVIALAAWLLRKR